MRPRRLALPVAADDIQCGVRVLGWPGHYRLHNELSGEAVDIIAALAYFQYRATGWHRLTVGDEAAKALKHWFEKAVVVQAEPQDSKACSADSTAEELSAATAEENAGLQQQMARLVYLTWQAVKAFMIKKFCACWLGAICCISCVIICACIPCTYDDIWYMV